MCKYFQFRDYTRDDEGRLERTGICRAMGDTAMCTNPPDSYAECGCGGAFDILCKELKSHESSDGKL